MTSATAATPASLSVFIVDDEQPARNRLKELLGDCAQQLPLRLLGEASNGHEALDKLSAMPADVVLVDIRMPKMDGIELAQHLNKLPQPPIIIFTTAYDTYAIKAFELHAIDYLLKPLRQQRLLDALLRTRTAARVQNNVLQKIASQPRKNFSIQERGRVHLIPVEQVRYLRAELKYITVRTLEREYLIEESLSALEQEFAETFIRIHRNCLVATKEIEGFEKLTDVTSNETHWTVKLKGIEERMPISRRQQHIVKEM